VTSLFSSRPFRNKLSICLLLAGLVMIVYAQVVHFDFIIYDDPNYVQDNPHVNRGFLWSGIVWAFTTFHAANWHPLTWLSLMLDGELYGNYAGGYHWTNVMLHLANTLLLFLVLQRMTGAWWRSGFVAALFAVHPLHVESVAWVAERKDVLSGFFWFLTLGVYVRYVESPSAVRYFLVVVFFVLGLMSKPMVVTLPLVLLLLDFWPLGRPEFREGRRRRLVLEKLPLLFLSALSSAVTVYAQQAGGALQPLDKIALSDRLANAGVSYVAYIYKMIWPDRLALLYPYPKAWSMPAVVLSVAVLSLLTILVIRARSSYDYLKTGWFWYVLTLLPVIGIVQVGNQAMADRYTYIPMIGIFMALAWLSAAWAAPGKKSRFVAIFCATAFLLAMTASAHRQTALWKNSETILGSSLAKTTGNYEAANNLGVVYFQKRQFDQAIIHLEKAIAINPDFAIAYNNLGQAYVARGDLDKGISLFRKGLELSPGLIKMQRNLAAVLFRKGDSGGAAALYRRLIVVNPHDPDLYNDFGAALAAAGDIENARVQFQAALRLRSDHEAALYNLKLLEKNKRQNVPHQQE